MPVRPAEPCGWAARGNLRFPTGERGARSVPIAAPSPQVLVAKSPARGGVLAVAGVSGASSLSEGCLKEPLHRAALLGKVHGWT